MAFVGLRGCLRAIIVVIPLPPHGTTTPSASFYQCLNIARLLQSFVGGGASECRILLQQPQRVRQYGKSEVSRVDTMVILELC